MDYLEMDKIRIKLGWTKRKLANELGIKDKTIYGYYRNKSNIPKPIAKLISAYAEGYRQKE